MFPLLEIVQAVAYCYSPLQLEYKVCYNHLLTTWCTQGWFHVRIPQCVGMPFLFGYKDASLE